MTGLLLTVFRPNLSTSTGHYAASKGSDSSVAGPSIKAEPEPNLFAHLSGGCAL